MESQCGFKRERGTIGNVFILNHLTQREKNGSTDEIYAVFVDLKAAFDNVDRKLLWDNLEKNGISEGLIRKLKKMHEETVAAVRTEDGISEIFSSRKGMRQDCVLSPLLFNLYIADIDVFMRNKRRRCEIKKGENMDFGICERFSFNSEKQRDNVRYVGHTVWIPQG